MNDKTISRTMLTAAIENMGGEPGDIREFAGAPAVHLDEARQLPMFAVEVSKEAAFHAVNRGNDVTIALDVVVNLFDAVRDTGTGPGVVYYFPRWYFAEEK